MQQKEISNLNRIVTMFLDYAEDRVSQRRHLTLADWQGNTDRFLAFNERPVLDGPGKMSHDQMKAIVHQRYDAFDDKRKNQEALDADAKDIKELEELERQLEK